MFIIQKIIWAIFGTKRRETTTSAISASSLDLQASGSNDSASPRRLVALLKVGAAIESNQLPRIGLGRAWAQSNFDASTSHLPTLMVGAQALHTSTSTPAPTPGLARAESWNHRRLTALR